MSSHAAPARERPDRGGSVLAGPLGLMVSMAAPAVIAVVGVVALGFDEIDWAAAIVWGVVATAAFTLFSVTGTAMGMTRMDLLDLLGSVFAAPGTWEAWWAIWSSGSSWACSTTPCR